MRRSARMCGVQGRCWRLVFELLEKYLSGVGDFNSEVLGDSQRSCRNFYIANVKKIHEYHTHFVKASRFKQLFITFLHSFCFYFLVGEGWEVKSGDVEGNRRWWKFNPSFLLLNTLLISVRFIQHALVMVLHHLCVPHTSTSWHVFLYTIILQIH